MAGHAFLAFTLVTVTARLLDVDARHALVLGVTAALFAVLPDVDMVYAWTEIATVFTTGLSGFVDAFWTASQATHRGISHSLVTAVIGATGFSLLYTGRDAAAAATFTGLLAGAFVFGGLLPLGVMAVFIAAGVGITGFLRKNTGLSGAAFFAAALAGLGSHPFGDVFTGQPPTFLHPMDIPVLTERVVLHPDPVINLLSVFLLELGTVVAGTALFLALTGRPVRDHVHPVAGLGLLYGAAVVIVPAPTLQVSYQFVYSLLVLGAAAAVGVALATGTGVATLVEDVRTLYRDPFDQANRGTVRAVVTGIAATLIGYIAYVTGYILL